MNKMINRQNITELLQNNLLQLRKNKKVSQEQVAEKTGISRTSIVAYENGKSIPDVEKLWRLSQYFKVSMDDLLSVHIQEDKVDIDIKQAPCYIVIEISGKQYMYACFEDNIKIGDFVLVTGRASNLIFKVKKVIMYYDMKEEDIEKVTEEVTCKLLADFSKYERRKTIRKKYELKNILNKCITSKKDFDIMMETLQEQANNIGYNFVCERRTNK